MNIDIVNFAWHAKPKEMRWFIGRQLPDWIQQMLKAKANGDDCGQTIEALAEVCCVTPETEWLK